MRRSQVREALDQIPDRALFGPATEGLTPKMRKFAREVAKGATKAEAYRTAYKASPAPSTIACAPYKLASDARVKKEIEAYRMALEAAEYRTPAALRSLVIQSLTETLLSEDTPPAVKVQAAKVLGTVTEVAAFTERREVTRIDNSQAAREKLLNEIKDMMRTVDMPATADADSLLAELAGSEPHPGGTTPDANATHQGDMHTIPPIQSQSDSDQSSDPEILPADPHPLDMETPPGKSV